MIKHLTILQSHIIYFENRGISFSITEISGEKGNFFIITPLGRISYSECKEDSILFLGYSFDEAVENLKSKKYGYTYC